MAIRQTVEQTGIYKTTRQSLDRPLDTHKPVPIEHLADLRAMIGQFNDATRQAKATWLDDAERWVKSILDSIDADPSARADAEVAWGHLAAVRNLLASGAIRDLEAGYFAYQLGRDIERLAVRPFELLVDKKRRLVRWHGRTCAVTKREHDILSAVIGRAEPLLRQVVKHVWGDRFNAKKRTKYDTAINRLNDKLSKAGIGLTLHVRGDRLVADEASPM